MASGQLYIGSILCSFLSENILLFRRTVGGQEALLYFNLFIYQGSEHSSLFKWGHPIDSLRHFCSSPKLGGQVISG